MAGAVLALTGCYGPSVQSNLPCSADGSCPRGQTCELTTRICDGTATDLDASTPQIDAPRSGVWTVSPLGISGSNNDEDPTMTADRLLVVFARRNGGQKFELYAATRSSTTAAWSAPARVMELNFAPQVTSPELSADGLAVFFTFGSGGARDVFYATRQNRSQQWLGAMPVPVLSTSSDDVGIGVRPDGAFALLDNDSSGERDLYTSTRAGSGWSTPQAAAGLHVQGRAEGSPTIGTDGTVYFHVLVNSTYGIWKGTPQGSGYLAAPVPELAGYSDPFLLPDGTLMLCAKNGVLYQASR
jgi:hypothetical protein